MDKKHFSTFKEILDDKGVLSPSENLDFYEIGARGDAGKAAFVLRPTTTEQVSKIISYCARHDLHLIPQSANTGLVGGSTPDHSGEHIVLSLERMNRVYDIDTVNLSAHVGAGVKLWGFNDILISKHELELPIDLGADPCIGGMIATNTGGARFLKYRGMREYVLGVKAVLADEHGTIIDVLCPLHKNNTGLDVKQLFIGSGGVLGVITEAIVRLTPIPKQSATALLIPQSLERIHSILTYIEAQCGSYLSAFEGMSGQAMQRALAHSPALTSPFGADGIPDYAILLELSRSWNPREGEQSLDEVLEAVLAQIWEQDDTPLENAFIGAPDKLWALRHMLSEGVQKSGKLFAFDLSFKRGDVMRFCADMKKALSQEYPDITLCDFGHIGDGAVHFNLVAPADTDVNESELRAWVIEHVIKAGGSYSAEHGLGRKNQAFYDIYTPDEVKALTRAIKKAIAPAPIGTIKV